MTEDKKVDTGGFKFATSSKGKDWDEAINHMQSMNQLTREYAESRADSMGVKILEQDLKKLTLRIDQIETLALKTRIRQLNDDINTTYFEYVASLLEKEKEGLEKRLQELEALITQKEE
jgi:ABC-type phosphate transport system auxiliary subunit